MPYIIPEKRTVLDPIVDELYHALVGLQADDELNNMEGNLNYLITRLLRKVYGTSYAEINAATGMLFCVALENYRTIAAPYEEQKKYENGDVEVDATPIYTDEVLVEDTSE